MTTTSEQKLSLIFGRRSVRIYSPGEISDGDVQVLLEAAMAAPSAMTKDPWRFVIVRSPNTLAKLAQVLPGGKMLSIAVAAILVCGDLEAAFEQQVSFLLQDCSACTENLLLAAHALGLGACWVGVHPGEEAIRRVKQIFSLPGAIVPVAVVSLGLPGEQLEPRTRFAGEKVHRETW